MKIVIPDPIAIDEKYIAELRDLGAEIYDDAPDLEALKLRIRDAEIITTRPLALSDHPDVTAEVIDAAPNLKYIVTPSVGTNHIDVAYATSKGIRVLNCATFNSQAVAEHAIGLLLATNRQLAEGDARLRVGNWDQKSLIGYELGGKLLALIGYGHIGKKIEALAAGLGINVEYTRSMSTDEETDALLARADFVIICAPLTDATRGMIDARRLSLMKSSALLINIARGPIVNQPDLITALRSGQIRGAGLDVFEVEPKDDVAPSEIVELATLANTVTVPHIAYFTHEANEKLGAELVADITSCLDSQLINLVN